MCYCWRWCRHRRAPLRREERMFGVCPQKDESVSLPETDSQMPSDRHKFLRQLQEDGPLKPPVSRLPVCSRVQSGAVCQWWLSWVKHVRPGMLHVSLFCSRLSSLRSFFLRFCSRSSHTLSFSCRPFLRAQRTTHAYDLLGVNDLGLVAHPSGWAESSRVLRLQLGPDPRAFLLLWTPSAPPPSSTEMGVQCLVWLHHHI